MATIEIAKQYDLFSGEAKPVTVQVSQKDLLGTQLEMFPQKELAQFGVRANPQLSLSEHTRLVLIREDPRTPEERERDNLREEHSLITPMFPDEVSAPPVTSMQKLGAEAVPDIIFTPPDMVIESLPCEELQDDGNVWVSLSSPQKRSKLDVYKQVVTVVAEQHATLKASSVCILGQKILLSITLFEAKNVGLTETEIASAMMIGEFQAKKEMKSEKEHSKSNSEFSVVPIGSVNWIEGKTSERPEMATV